ncbi:sigmaY antisigma factor component [Paenibacillus sp. FA6]|uniref:sigmaY antisigma factor component n=1 Tax=Paenibacillus sp. FA6 TaxID=3413029 RepID=UPI003F65E68E
MSELKEIPIWLITTIVPILLVQGTWMFLDAGKWGKWRWFWGIWGLINTPLPLLIYLFFVRFPDNRKKRHSREDE